MKGVQEDEVNTTMPGTAPDSYELTIGRHKKYQLCVCASLRFKDLYSAKQHS